MSKAVGFLTGQASMAFEMLSTAWKALKKKIVAESFFFIMHLQLLPNLMDQRIAIISFPLSKSSFGTLMIQPNSTLRLRALCSSLNSPMLLSLIRVYHARIHLLA